MCFAFCLEAKAEKEHFPLSLSLPLQFCRGFMSLHSKTLGYKRLIGEKNSSPDLFSFQIFSILWQNTMHDCLIKTLHNKLILSLL